jgi:hypothetical protein
MVHPAAVNLPHVPKGQQQIAKVFWAAAEALDQIARRVEASKAPTIRKLAEQSFVLINPQQQRPKADEPNCCEQRARLDGRLGAQQL